MHSVHSFTVLSLAFLAAAYPQSAPIGERSEQYLPNPSVGGGGNSSFNDSAHFRVYGAEAGEAEKTLVMMEAVYDCFVTKLGWRSSGLSLNGGDTGPKYKENIYAESELGGAAGVMSASPDGYSFVKVVPPAIADPFVTVHEYGHALTYHEKFWVEQTRTGVWWEPMANWFADTYVNSNLCAEARKKSGQTYEGKRLAAEAIPKIINGAHNTIVDGSVGTGNYYQAWPFMTYLTENPDRIKGLGPTAVRDMIRKYTPNSDGTPLHGLVNVIAPEKLSRVVGRYWAHMAFGEIGHKVISQAFQAALKQLSFANLDPAGTAAGGKRTYKVKAARRPKYMGANIIPLKATSAKGGSISISVKASMPFTAVVGVKTSAGIKYTDLSGGKGTVNAPAGASVRLVVANAPNEPILYDGFSVKSGPVAKGLDYTLTLTGATA